MLISNQLTFFQFIKLALQVLTLEARAPVSGLSGLGRSVVLCARLGSMGADGSTFMGGVSGAERARLQALLDGGADSPPTTRTFQEFVSGPAVAQFTQSYPPMCMAQLSRARLATRALRVPAPHPDAAMQLQLTVERRKHTLASRIFSCLCCSITRQPNAHTCHICHICHICLRTCA